MKWFIGIILAVIVMTGAATIAYLLFTGPRMYVQPSIRPFQVVMPAPSPNSIPVAEVFEPLLSKEQSLKLVNPLAKNKENIAKGKVYYGYYCAFCHGQSGDGFGPVGYSYIPAPSDLRNPKIRSMSDGEVLYSMLTGTGHAPVLQRTILPEYRWHLVLYVRQLGNETPSGQ